jgi:hypothetical protein
MSQRAQREAAPLFRAASRDPGQSLDPSVRRSLELRTGHDFGRVRVHHDDASADAAGALHANAVTIGRDIFLGKTAAHMSPRERAQLLTHEAVHTLQQRNAGVENFDALPMSKPSDAGESEARAIATQPFHQARVSAITAAPMMQCDLTGSRRAGEGDFRLNLRTESHAGAKSGMSGTIAFHPAATAPDSPNIRLYQAIRLQELSGAVQAWTGTEAPRQSFRTAANPARPNYEAGWGMDVKASAITPRTAAADPAVSPYYRDHWPNATSSQNGSKSGTTITDASLWDYPGSWGRNTIFTFETVAQAANGHVYGTLYWGFTVRDHTAGTVDGEHAAGRAVTLQTTDDAMRLFNEHYRNPGSSTAPP